MNRLAANPIFQMGVTKFKKMEGPLTALGIILLAASLLFCSRQEDKAHQIQEDSPSLDTLIPAGMVLVPLDLANAQSLSGLFGDFAIVDLFEVSIEGKGIRNRVGEKLRLIRSPRDPEKMAVLVPEGQESRLMTTTTPLFAVLQNGELTKSGHVPEVRIKRNRIEYHSRGSQ